MEQDIRTTTLASRAVSRLVKVVILPPFLAVFILLVFTMGAKSCTGTQTSDVKDNTGDKVPGSLAILDHIHQDNADVFYTLRTIDASHPVLIYVSDPSGMPAILLNSFLARNPGLTQNFTLVVYDQRGTGKSMQSGKEGPATIDQLSNDLIKLSQTVRNRMATESKIPGNKIPVYLHAYAGGNIIAVRALESGEFPFAGYSAVSFFSDDSKNPVSSTKLLAAAYLAPEYTMGDTLGIQSRWKKSRQYIPLLQKSSLADSKISLDLPVLFYMGKKDSRSNVSKTQTFFENNVHAKGKKYIVSEKVSSNAHLEDVETYMKTLSEFFLGITEEKTEEN